MTIESLRKQLRETSLARDHLLGDPVEQFATWYKQAEQAALHYPHAMCLSTVSAEMEASSRIVLLRYFDQQGFVFFSGYETAKAAHIAKNPSVALLFSWLDLERQVRITGKAEKISIKESLQFFASRSRESQIGAWLSQSGGEISSRALLRSSFAQIRQEFVNKKIPLPGRWGGYRVRPTSYEFWQGHSDGIHDRFKYRWNDHHKWEIRRLKP
jgi:pyridoxamine 5'-phosphate oxidase